MRAISEAPSPKNVTELWPFLGMVNYYDKFHPDLSKFLAPLNKLLHNDTKWHWSKEKEESFQEAEELRLSAKLLVQRDPDKEIRCPATPHCVDISVRINSNTADGAIKGI